MRWMRDLKTATKILGLVGILVALMILVSWTGYSYNTRSAASLSAMYRDNLVPLRLVEEFRTSQNEVEALLFHLILETEEKEIADIRSRLSVLSQTTDDLLEKFTKTDLDEEEQELLKKLSLDVINYRRAWKFMAELATGGRKEEAFKQFKQNVRRQSRAVQEKLVALAESRVTRAEQANEENEIRTGRAKRLLVLIPLGSLLLAALFGVTISRAIVKPLASIREGIRAFSEGNLQVAFDTAGLDEIAEMGQALDEMVKTLRDTISGILAAGSRVEDTARVLNELSHRTNDAVEETKNGVERVSEAMESLAAAGQEINASVEEVAAGAQTAAQRSADTAEQVQRAEEEGQTGIAAVKKVVESIRGVAIDSENAAGAVVELGTRARNIQGFVAQISQIADQTNLLALNAAIEAARAGDAGRGFAVVAEEVRKLAEESNTAARNIADLAETITRDLDGVVSAVKQNAAKSGEARDLAAETEATIARILEALRTIGLVAQDMAAVSQEQAASSEEIAGAVQNVAERVNNASSIAATVRSRVLDVAAATEEVASGAETLARVSEALQEKAAFFRMENHAALVSGENGGA
ncbi:methyl-accepting chemotaxis protein [Aminiphilus circumscriptus]|jgi:methyl-accepting chemotaxis protein|uniref:methyl-accepting chemotaxis protein n=1 Tax=Aminiphilus circumscriptus TaxID=290732 RepID=UPI00049251B2|nr:methyl-accepting chemotaxis protein [Aminiphilus circumscriptus]